VAESIKIYRMPCDVLNILGPMSLEKNEIAKNE
jgi:hypothetical protein